MAANPCHSYNADEWMMDSIFRYQRLHMYDLQRPLTSTDWVNNKSVCLATSNGISHEIWQVNLPDDLLEEEQDSNLSKDRDFKLAAGGFSDRKVACIKCFNSNKCVVTSQHGKSSIELFKLCSNSTSDVMKKQRTIENPRCNSSASHLAKMSADKVAFGSSLDNVCLADLTTQSVVHHTQAVKPNAALCQLVSLSASTLLGCCVTTGQLWLMDLRLKNPLEAMPKLDNESPVQGRGSGQSWTMAPSEISSAESNLNTVWRLSSTGEVLENCLTNLTDPCFSVKPGVFQDRNKSPNDQQYIQVSNEKNPLISISGFDGHIQIFESLSWKRSKDAAEVEPMFVHDGHKACSVNPKTTTPVCHCWHPSKHGLLLSAASDSSLHVFEPCRL